MWLFLYLFSVGKAIPTLGFFYHPKESLGGSMDPTLADIYGVAAATKQRKSVPNKNNKTNVSTQ